jgi:hypothetical protein
VSHVGSKLPNNLAYYSTTESSRLSSPLPLASLGLSSSPQCGYPWLQGREDLRMVGIEFIEFIGFVEFIETGDTVEIR